MIQDTPDGTTHSYNDGCGIKEHNKYSPFDRCICGMTHAEHDVSRSDDAPVPRIPCVGLVKNFILATPEHNMTLREKWELYATSTIADHDELNINDVFKWFLSQFDAMLAEDIEKMKGMKQVQNPNKVLNVEHRVSIDIYNKSIDASISILEARRLFIKK